MIFAAKIGGSGYLRPIATFNARIAHKIVCLQSLQNDGPHCFFGDNGHDFGHLGHLGTRLTSRSLPIEFGVEGYH